MLFLEIMCSWKDVEYSAYILRHVAGSLYLHYTNEAYTAANKVFQLNHTSRCSQEWITVPYMSGGFPQSLLIPNLQSHSEENIPTEMNGNTVLIISWWKFFTLTLDMQDRWIPVGLRLISYSLIFRSENVGDQGLHSILNLTMERNFIHFQSKKKSLTATAAETH